MTGIMRPSTADEIPPRHPALVGQRIALFTGAYNHIADGVSLTLNRLVAYLEAHGAEVLVFAPTIDNPPVDHVGTLASVPSFLFPGRHDYPVSVGLTPGVRKRLKAFDPTLVHIATPDFLGRSALVWAGRRDIPVVGSYHTHFSSYFKYYHLTVFERPLWFYMQWFYGRCAHIYVPSESMIDVLRSHGITEGLRLWERGVETDLFTPKRRSLAWRRALGVQDEEVIVSYVGRIVWEKGLRVFADVIESLRARGIPHRAMMVGDGPAEKELMQRLPDTIFTGYLEGTDLARAYASSDVFLFPSDTETFGNVTLEAMASGLPAVCADATGSRSLVDHGTTGFLATPRDAQSFLDATERLVTDTALRKEMGHNALEKSRHYEWEAVMARLAGYYEEIFDPALVLEGDSLPEQGATVEVHATARPFAVPQPVAD
jgi:glycosyltransferase involved in cell wall biosynthesis